MKTTPLYFRLDPELHGRYQRIVRHLRISEPALTRSVLAAFCEFAETPGRQISFPLKFDETPPKKPKT